MIVLAVANDVYEVYTSTNKARTITSKVVGWESASIGATYGAATLSESGPGAILGAVGGGILGYWISTTVKETVYDWIFTKMK